MKAEKMTKAAKTAKEIKASVRTVSLTCTESVVLNNMLTVILLP